MKQRLIILFCCFVLAINLSACQSNESPRSRIELPITQFAAYSTIIQAENDTLLLVKGDSQNFCLWIDSCPIIGEVDADISDKWDYKIIFCNTDNIIIDNSTYYIPHTATIHAVYISEGDNIIQFDNVAYSLKSSDADSMSFYDGIRAYLTIE